ncbi:hypothetical protein BH695_2160 [Microcystis aeruginosa PCC 7806SL]|uniref:Uncharacterized protein n=1 Tax=Microcystis aeruginosa PCC 7806SL TaxID=1903187 RepID=A0AB33BXG0_MICA7|nr:hypothetical protein BH695_2160 [Microcystis aeruginosa PCC 7806SL]
MSFSIRVPSLITPVYCIRQTEEPDYINIFDWLQGYSWQRR